MRGRLAPVALAWLLGGCGGGLSCPSDEPYRFSREEPPLMIPQGLDVPESDSALVVPPLSDAPKERPPGIPPCLERPPSYIEDRPRPEG